jgi:hypothetical protein
MIEIGRITGCQSTGQTAYLLRGRRFGRAVAFRAALAAGFRGPGLEVFLAAVGLEDDAFLCAAEALRAGDRLVLAPR